MKRLKILHTEASCGWGGQELRILTEALGMIKRGHEVALLAPAHSRVYEEAERRGVPVFAAPIEKKRVEGFLAILRFLRHWQPDCINTHSSTDSWLVAFAVQFYRKAAVVRTRHISTEVKRSFLNRWLYHFVTAHVVTTGQSIRRQLIEGLKIPANHITSIPTGIDLSLYRPADKQKARAALGLPLERPLVGIVATLRGWKGHYDLLQAFALLKEKPHLVIVGDGPQEAALKETVEKLGLQERVHFAGYQRHPEQWLQALDLYVLPSYANEGVPQGLMQAMATGVPVITTNVGSILELVRPNETGVIVPTRNPEALSRAIEALLSDSVEQERLTQAARAHVEASYSLDEMIEQMEAIFTKAKKSPS